MGINVIINSKGNFISRGDSDYKIHENAGRTFQGSEKQFWYVLGCSASKNPQLEFLRVV